MLIVVILKIIYNYITLLSHNHYAIKLSRKSIHVMVKFYYNNYYNIAAFIYIVRLFQYTGTLYIISISNPRPI